MPTCGAVLGLQPSALRLHTTTASAYHPRSHHYFLAERPVHTLFSFIPYSHHKFMGSARYLHSASIACQLPGCNVTAVRCCDGCPSMERAEACWLDMSWMSSQQQTETQNSWPAAMAPVGCCTLLQLHGCCIVIKLVKLQTVPQVKHVIE